jgi:LDH2 family malate/lactate/ureidoglycolate dehydrogenase
MGHLMGALRIDGFRPVDEVQTDMEATFDRIRASDKAPGHDRIYIHGEPETLAEERNLEEGIPVSHAVVQQLEIWGDRLGVAPVWP